MNIRVKRVYEDYDVTDGVRVLVDRLWPRGLRKATSKVDIWMRDVAPSDGLRKWFSHDPKKWMRFKSKYRVELKDNRELQKLVQLAVENGTVTLVFAALDQRHNNAVALAEVLRRKAERASKAG
ncbi:MAG: DUF488 family protein [Candidatus Micrarchaeota archaeon]|nr:DUF488 family protein [Candidatus Micrarchaeota archaeon]